MASRTTSSAAIEMRICWADEAWEDYLWWQTQDRRTLRRTNSLVWNIAHNGNEELGKPEALRYQLSSYWSRCTTEEYRPIYRITDTGVQIVACRHRYGH